ncbi:MAG: hypothetical protein ACRC2T_16915 [Thermoguttaceae bacterium]
MINSGMEPTYLRLDGWSFTLQRQVSGGETLSEKQFMPERQGSRPYRAPI